MRVEHDGRYAAVASKGGAPEHPDGIEDFVERPLVEVQDATEKADLTAREVTGEEREQWWRRAVDVCPDCAVYQPKIDRRVPVSLCLEPVRWRRGRGPPHPEGA